MNSNAKRTVMGATAVVIGTVICILAIWSASALDNAIWQLETTTENYGSLYSNEVIDLGQAPSGPTTWADALSASDATMVMTTMWSSPSMGISVLLVLAALAFLATFMWSRTAPKLVPVESL